MTDPRDILIGYAVEVMVKASIRVLFVFGFLDAVAHQLFIPSVLIGSAILGFAIRDTKGQGQDHDD